MAKASEPWSARQQRQLSYISEFTTDIRHVHGKDNTVADTLSRAEEATISDVHLGIDYLSMARDQQQDADTQDLLHNSTTLQLQKVPFGPQGVTLICDMSTSQPRPVVPRPWQRRVFDIVHSLSHPSIRTTRKMITGKFVWKGLKKQVGTWARQCIPCQSSKVQTHTKSPSEHILVPQRRFDHIHVDLVGPLPPSNGSTHLFTIVDRFSRWPEAIPLNDTSAVSCAQALVSHWISRFGIPIDMSSDRGSQFTSQLWRSVAQLLGTKLHHTTSYHPQSNGLVERFHRHLKSALRARLTRPTWTQELPWVLLGIRTAPREDLGCSPAEMVYGAPLTVPGDFIPSQSVHSDDLQLARLREQVKSQVPIPTSRHGQRLTSVPRNLQQAKFVFIRRDSHRTTLQRPYYGPFRVIKPGPKTFQVDIQGKTETISIDRLKYAHTDPDFPTLTTETSQRGCPTRDIHSSPSPVSLQSPKNHSGPLQQNHDTLVLDASSKSRNGTFSVLTGSGVADDR